MTPEKTRSTTRMPGLDGLRALACLMVFAVHWGQISQLGGSLGPLDIGRLVVNGNSGVALFFALSGFLLSRPYWHALRTSSVWPSSTRFLVRRAARIVPAYYLCLTALIIANRLWTEDGWQANVLAHYVFVFNLLDASIFSINPPFWTIAVEVQFYLVLPLIFFACRRLGAGGTAAAFCALALCSYATHAMLMGHLMAVPGPTTGVSPVASQSVLAHLPHFLLGVLAAWLQGMRAPRPWTPSREIDARQEFLLWSAVILLVSILGTPLDDWLQVPYGRYNLPFVPLLFCIVIVLTPTTATGAILLDNKLLRTIGILSYGIYVYHLPALHVTARLMGRFGLSPTEHWLACGAMGLAATLVAAGGSHYLIEQKVIALVRRL